MTNIEMELQKATGVKPKPKEGSRYLSRLLDAVAKLPADGWNGLSVETQKWYNDAATASSNGGEIPPFPNEEVEVALKETNGAKSGAKKAAPKAAKKPAAESKVAADKAEKSPIKLDESGVKYRIKKAILKKPNISKEELVEVLGKGGEKVSELTVASIRTEFRHSLRVLAQEGKYDAGL